MSLTPYYQDEAVTSESGSAAARGPTEPGASDYATFLVSKQRTWEGSGLTVDESAISPVLYPFQRAITRWALLKGRAAIFADCGLGKTFMQLEWARLIAKRTLIIAPLSVARQTVAEARKIGLDVHYSRDGRAADHITITNYEMAPHFTASEFQAIVLDESSILKSLDGKTRQKLTEQFASVPHRLCCTATPAPNDIAEIANHSEFLGIMRRQDLLAMFFVHKSNTHAQQGWFLKAHAEHGFYRWLASWGMSLRRPSDIGYSDEGYTLPSLTISPLFTATAYRRDGELFSVGLRGIGDRHRARRGSLSDRVSATADLVNGDHAQWIVWCGLNDEGQQAHALIRGSVLVEGHQSPEDKLAAIEGFQDGTHRVLITKPRIAGFGMNFQHCHKMAFLGLSDSWESYYQCIRRSWRFGQQRPVEAHIVLSEPERGVYDNVMRKEADASRMADSLIVHVRDFERAELTNGHRTWAYTKASIEGNGYRLLLGDTVERLPELPSESIDFSIFSPPFLCLYTYTPTERDIGNSQGSTEYWAHFGYVIDDLLRVMKPGRNCAVHVAQVAATLITDGYIGLKDFRGEMIREFVKRGWVYHGEVCVDKDPQAQAIRTHAKGLLFIQLKKDGSWLRPGLADYILVFRKPGDNTVPILPEISNEEWIEWARPVWYGIRATNTLNTAEGKGAPDERHICPLQLDLIERCVKLWSNPGETVLSPFAGIGSEGYVSLLLNRQFVGIELKESYFDTAKKSLNRAIHERDAQLSLM